MNKVIFLDIDGVLNTTGDKDLLFDVFDNTKLQNVIKLKESTNSEIVIISDRRIYMNDRIIINKAFMLYNTNISYMSYNRTQRHRSDEVVEYLSNNDISKFVILDDNDLGYSKNVKLKDHFVNTERYGFTNKEFSLAFDILMK